MEPGQHHVGPIDLVAGAAEVLADRPEIGTRPMQLGRALATHPEIPFAATTRPTNLLVSALFRDTQHLYEHLTGPLADLPGVRSVQTAPIIRTLKRTGSVLQPACEGRTNHTK